MYYTIENEFLTAQINDFGAELHSLKTKSDDHEYIWQGDPSVWYGQAPVLFPIIGRLLGDKYRYNGTEYTLQKHGFARKRQFEVVSCERNEAVFVLRNDADTLASYPFAFELYVKFILLGRSLHAIHTVVNRSEGEMYFSIGGHPAFNCAIGDWLEFDKNETLDTETIDDDSIRLAEKKPVLQGEKRITITEHLFDHDALILSGIHSKAVTLRNEAHAHEVRFTFGDVPYLGIWAKPGAPYVCIEPWCGVNDDRRQRADISEKDAIQRLPRGGVFDLAYTAEIL
ncbi:MAG: aldose 1-epimerase family protein [Clostridia bacterium]|nr:aldose 1-epimerase family protein [Clostridia bacterium]